MDIMYSDMITKTQQVWRSDAWRLDGLDGHYTSFTSNFHTKTQTNWFG